jgi:outer membrane protein
MPRRLLPALLLLSCATAAPAYAASDALVDLLAIPGSAGLGGLQRSAASPYKGATTTYDLVPLYMYEGSRVFLHASRIGIKLNEQPHHTVDLFLDYRFEGYPNDRTPAVLAGMEKRAPSVDLGWAYRYRDGVNNVDAELLHDADNASHGTELRLRYSADWRDGRLHLRPSATLARRDARLNNYYYGVRASEANALRPAYQAGAGTDWMLALYGYYEITERWRLLGGVGITLPSSVIRHSPVVEDRPQPNGLVGLAYDFGSHKAYSEPGLPLHLKLLAGRATECNFLPVVSLRCGSTRSEDDTRIAAVALGRPLIERVNNWPLDFVAYVELLRHDERAVVPSAWQVDASIKAYFYGFPWRDTLRTRVGMAAGFSLAERVPLAEVRDQSRRGRETSRLLNFLDPSFDVSVGDLLGVAQWKERYIGVGVSHRSGIFGASQILGNINGGSNYLYLYFETKL